MSSGATCKAFPPFHVQEHAGLGALRAGLTPALLAHWHPIQPVAMASLEWAQYVGARVLAAQRTWEPRATPEETHGAKAAAENLVSAGAIAAAAGECEGRASAAVADCCMHSSAIEALFIPQQVARLSLLIRECSPEGYSDTGCTCQRWDK